MKTILPVLAGCLMCVAVPRIAEAAPVTITICLEYTHSFTDASTGDGLTGSTNPARGVHLKTMRESDSVDVNNLFVSAGGATPGCVTLDGNNGTAQLDTAQSYTIKVPRDATLNSNSIVVKTSGGASLVGVPKTGLVPQSGRTYSPANGDPWTSLAASDAVHIMAAATAALWDHNAGLSGETIEFRDGSCPGSGGSCYDDFNELVWIGDPSRKFVIGYMMGMAVAHFRNGKVDINTDNSAALNGCTPGATASGATLMNSKEYTSEAAYHGWGLFYAAAAFNTEGTDDDCDFESAVAVDWNVDNDMADSGEDNIFSCEDSPAPGLGVNDEDYVGQFCFGSGVVANRGVKYDWLRMLWDFRTNSGTAGYTVVDLFDWFVNADPDTWNANGDVYDVDDPSSRLVGASPMDFGDFVDIADNGGAN